MGGGRGTKHGNYGDKISPCTADPRHIELSGRLIHARDLRRGPCCPELKRVLVMSNLILLVMSNLLQPAAVFLIWKQGSTCAEQYFYTQTEHKNMNTHAEAKPCTCSATHTLFMEAKLTSESVCLQKLALCVSGLENQNIRSAPYSRLGLE